MPHGTQINNYTDFAAYLLEDAKVALVPGVAFGADKYARLSYAISMENIKKGMDRIEEITTLNNRCLMRRCKAPHFFTSA